MSESKPDGNWGDVVSSELSTPDDEDPIQQVSLQIDDLISKNAPKEDIARLEKRLWDMIYRKRMFS
jgi:hypothetical protein